MVVMSEDVFVQVIVEPDWTRVGGVHGLVIVSTQFVKEPLHAEPPEP
jgi:hypothetical protein